MNTPTFADLARASAGNILPTKINLEQQQFNKLMANLPEVPDEYVVVINKLYARQLLNIEATDA